MDESIDRFCQFLSTSCNHVQRSCQALKQSVDRRLIPLDSASSTFVHCLNRRVSTTSSDLNLLESMSFGTVSFEELLGHCHEVYKKNESDVLHLQDHLTCFGYSPEFEIEDDGEEERRVLDHTSSPDHGLNWRTVDEDPLFEESLSLKSLGLSDACLATIATEANIEINELHQPNMNSLVSVQGSKFSIIVSKEDYKVLPSQLKYLASWEDLLVAVEKINSGLKMKENSRGNIHQDEIESLNLGRNWRSYLLLLIRMDRLVIESTDGLTSYRIL